MIPTAILDTTLLSNFSHLRRPDLIRWALGEKLATTPQALAELKVGESEGLVPICDWSWLTVLELSQAEEGLAAELPGRLDPGESEFLRLPSSAGASFYPTTLPRVA